MGVEGFLRYKDNSGKGRVVGKSSGMEDTVSFFGGLLNNNYLY